MSCCVYHKAMIWNVFWVHFKSPEGCKDRCGLGLLWWSSGSDCLLQCRDWDLIPGRETKIPHTMQWSQKKRKRRRRRRRRKDVKKKKKERKKWSGSYILSAWLSTPTWRSVWKALFLAVHVSVLVLLVSKVNPKERLSLIQLLKYPSHSPPSPGPRQ